MTCATAKIVVSSLLVLITLNILLSSTSVPVIAGNSSMFNVSLTVNNNLPVINSIQAIAASPAEGTTTVISFYFNASDGNGAVDIPASNANIIINQSGYVRNSTSCTIVDTTGTMNRYQCDITIDYYDQPGIWTINASIFDGTGIKVTSASNALTMGTVYGISISTNVLTFSGIPGTNDVSASNNPQLVTNTGNSNYNQLALTGISLKGTSNYINAGQFRVNVLASGGAGQALINNTPVVVINSDFTFNATKNIYIYLDVPNDVSGNYAAPELWTITAS